MGVGVLSMGRRGIVMWCGMKGIVMWDEGK